MGLVEVGMMCSAFKFKGFSCFDEVILRDMELDFDVEFLCISMELLVALVLFVPGTVGAGSVTIIGISPGAEDLFFRFNLLSPPAIGNSSAMFSCTGRLLIKDCSGFTFLLSVVAMAALIVPFRIELILEFVESPGSLLAVVVIENGGLRFSVTLVISSLLTLVAG